MCAVWSTIYTHEPAHSNTALSYELTHRFVFVCFFLSQRTKKVLVRDAKVGLIYFTTMLLVLLYVLVVAIVLDRGCVTQSQK